MKPYKISCPGNISIFFTSILIMVMGCSSQTAHNEKETKPLNAKFKEYWYSGKAELTRYELDQARYGEVHQGEAILIFVTEDFLTGKQVKLEYGESENATSVLKVNFLKRFATGIYDYSMETSVFTPVHTGAYPHSLKVASSSQDWCGHSYIQLNLRNNRYKVMRRSYFQKVVNQDYKIRETFLEDEIWTRLRIDPTTLPTGETKMIPGTRYARFKNLKVNPEKVKASLSPYKGNEFSGKNLEVYKVHYPEHQRTLKIVFEQSFPYPIMGWKETFLSGFGENARELTTVAHRTNTLVTDYWNKHSLKDSTLRKKLGVKF